MTATNNPSLPDACPECGQPCERCACDEADARDEQRRQEVAAALWAAPVSENDGEVPF